MFKRKTNTKRNFTTPKETEKEIKKVNVVISKNINLKLFIYNIEIFKQILSIFIRKLFEIFNIGVEYQTNMFCALILLTYVNNSI